MKGQSSAVIAGAPKTANAFLFAFLVFMAMAFATSGQAFAAKSSSKKSNQSRANTAVAPEAFSLATPDGRRSQDGDTILSCIQLASAEYQVSPALLHAIWLVEGGWTGTVRQNTNGTLDLGPMQINTLHLETLGRVGIDASMLAYDTCLNTRVGAWVLKTEMVRAGMDTWRGVGNYHSRTPDLHRRYIARVEKALQRILPLYHA